MKEVPDNDSATDVGWEDRAWTNCSIEPNQTYSIDDKTMPRNLQILGFTWIHYEPKGSNNYSFRFRSNKDTVYWFCDDDIENFGDKENPFTNQKLGGNVYEKWVAGFFEEHAISIVSPKPRIKNICRDSCPTYKAFDIAAYGAPIDNKNVYARVSVPVHSMQVGEALPKPLRDMGLVSIAVGECSAPISLVYKYYVEIKSNIPANFSFRDQDEKNAKDEKITGRTGKGDVYNLLLSHPVNPSANHNVRYNSKNACIVEVCRGPKLEGSKISPD